MYIYYIFQKEQDLEREIGIVFIDLFDDVYWAFIVLGFILIGGFVKYYESLRFRGGNNKNK